MAEEITSSAIFRDFLLDLLPKSQHGKVARIVEEFETYTTTCSAVLVDGAHVGIEEIEAYGLDITLDANGNAERVSCKNGLTPEWYGE